MDDSDRYKEFIINESWEKDKRLLIEEDFTDKIKYIPYGWNYQLIK